MVKVYKIFRKNTIFYENYSLTALDMYNAMSQVLKEEVSSFLQSWLISDYFKLAGWVRNNAILQKMKTTNDLQHLFILGVLD